MKYVLWAIVALIVILLAFILIRTLRFKPRKDRDPAVLDDEVTFDRDRAVENLRALVRCRTVSYLDPALEDDAEFEKLIALLPERYPNVFAVCSFERMPDRGLLFKWSGREAGDPAILMAHYDVVPVDEEGWDKPPFEGVLEDGVLWGRGTLDTKVTMNGVLTAADHLIGQGFVPLHDVYFAFSGGEEISAPGAAHIVDRFAEEGITPAMVVDEGGAVVENVFPGLKEPCALIGIGEKGFMNVRLTATSKGGHASAPKPGSPVPTLARACCRVEENPFKCRLTKPVAELFDTLGRRSNFLYRMVFANLWCFLPVLDLISRKSGGEMNALLRTTVAFTRMEGSTAANVIPPKASMVCNIRLNPSDSVENAMAQLRRTVNDLSVELEAFQAMEPSRISRTDCAGWDKVASAVASTWRGAAVSPYLMIQGSDSRHYGRISDRVYRFSAMDLTGEERATIHGHNERIRVETVHRCVEFYIRLIRQC